MGEVYRAYDPSLDRVVALKTILADRNDPKDLERFLREGKAAGRLKHPSIVTVYELGESEGAVFMAMEYLEGRSLAAFQQETRIPFLSKLALLGQVLEALDYAHRQGVVHRDIKPSNIQVLPDGSVKILDFGIARIMDSESMTRTGAIVGTPFYMPPEQLRGEKVDHRADIYSAGVVSYELLTKRRPFDGNSLPEVILKIINEPLPAMGNAWSAAFPEIERIVGKALSKNASDRYASAAEMAESLRRFAQSHDAEIRQLEARLETTSAAETARARSLATPDRLTQSIELLSQIVKRDPEATEAQALLAEHEALTTTQDQPMPAPATQPRVSVRPATGPGISEAARGAVIREASRVPASAVAPSQTSVRAALLVLGAVLGLVSGAVGLLALARLLGPADAPARSAITAPSQQAKQAEGSKQAARSPEATEPAAPPRDRPTEARRQAAERAATGSQPLSTGLPIVSVEPINDEAINAQLASGVKEALRAKGVTVRSKGPSDAISARVGVSLSVRPAPFAGTSALTADYAASVEFRAPREGLTKRFEFDGHVMEFGEPVVRAAALRELSVKVADALEPLVRRGGR